jgi:PhzF family phenazine biosynthesis protein
MIENAYISWIPDIWDFVEIVVHKVNAFTGRMAAGNPAGVCISNVELRDNLMQHVARQMNLSETAFLGKENGGTWKIRWFSPEREVDLCGHATLAAAYVLGRRGLLRRGQEVVFSTKDSNISLSALRREDDSIELNLPRDPSVERTAPRGLITALGVSSFGRRVEFSQNLRYLVMPLKDGQSVRSARPNFSRLRPITDAKKIEGVIITSVGKEGSGYDYASRFFAPSMGINEDPATGSSHCVLADYWNRRLDGKTEFVTYQASARGGFFKVKLEADRVYVSGEAVHDGSRTFIG